MEKLTIANLAIVSRLALAHALVLLHHPDALAGFSAWLVVAQEVRQV